MKRVSACVLAVLALSLIAGQLLSQTTSTTTASVPVSAPATASAPAPVLAAAREYPTFGVAIAPVDGWDRLAGRDPEIIVQWCHIDAQAVNMDGEIVAMIEPAVGRKLDDFAKTVAEETSMKLETERTQIGSQAAIVLAGNPAEKLFHPALAILCQRGNYFYQLLSYGESARDWRAELQAMADAWRWIDFQPPEKYLSPLDQSMPCFNGLFTLKGPSTIRGYNVPRPDDQAYLAIYDYLLNCPIFTVDIQRLSKDAATRPEEMQQDFARQLDAKLKKDKPLSWQTIRGPMKVYLSESYEVTLTPQKPAATKDAKAKPAITLPAPTGRMIVRNCLAFPTDKEATIISFSILAFEEPARQAYTKLVEDMAATFTSKPPVSPPAQTGK